MDERGATARDVQKALVTATDAEWQPDRQNYRVTGGVDLDGDSLSVAVDIEARRHRDHALLGETSCDAPIVEKKERSVLGRVSTR
jgi:hypothetical protein